MKEFKNSFKQDDKVLTAYFVSYPYSLDDLKKPHIVSRRKPYIIEKEITLGKIDYENFITDLCVDREYIEVNSSLMKIDETGTWHCILVRQKNKHDGILVMSDGNVFPKWAAYLYHKESADD